MSPVSLALKEGANVLSTETLDELRVSVSAVLFKNGKVVLLEHNKTGKITLPGGARDKGEELLPGLIRELYEELDVSSVDLLGAPVTATGEFADLHVGFRFETDDLLVNKEPHKHQSIILAELSELNKYEYTESAQATLRGFGLLK